MTDKLSERLRYLTLPGKWKRNPPTIVKLNIWADEVAALEAELEAVRQIMDQPWNDSHDKGRDEAHKRIAKISDALNMNNDPVTTEDTPSSG
jgi:hypothetical protein